jgi:hypothetical protein
MHTDHEISIQERLFVTTISGHLDLAELELEQRAEWQKLGTYRYNRLIDMRQAEVDRLLNADVIEYAIMPRMPIPPLCLAIVVDTDAQRILAQTYTAARYFTGHYTPNKVFDQLYEALAWIKEQDSWSTRRPL